MVVRTLSGINEHTAGLEIYTDFQVVVAAGTSLGYGPFSSPISVKTLQDGM